MAESDITHKTCSKCSVNREMERFPVNAKCRGGRSTICLDCFRGYRKAWELRNPERHRESKKRRATACKVNLESRRAAQRAYYSKIKANGAWRLRKNVARAIRHALNGRKSSASFNLLGYSPGQLKAHLERQFADGMSWSNYGEWHIDHIVPLAEFSFSKEPVTAEIRKAWALTNLRPLWAEENMKKRASRTHLL